MNYQPNIVNTNLNMIWNIDIKDYSKTHNINIYKQNPNSIMMYLNSIDFE